MLGKILPGRRDRLSVRSVDGEALLRSHWYRYPLSDDLSSNSTTKSTCQLRQILKNKTNMPLVSDPPDPSWNLACNLPSDNPIVVSNLAGFHGSFSEA